MLQETLSTMKTLMILIRQTLPFQQKARCRRKQGLLPNKGSRHIWRKCQVSCHKEGRHHFNKQWKNISDLFKQGSRI